MYLPERPLEKTVTVDSIWILCLPSMNQHCRKHLAWMEVRWMDWVMHWHCHHLWICGMHLHWMAIRWICLTWWISARLIWMYPICRSLILEICCHILILRWSLAAWRKWSGFWMKDTVNMWKAIRRQIILHWENIFRSIWQRMMRRILSANIWDPSCSRMGMW